ncbi:MAG: diacylglycerol kinase family protein [Bacteroidia bacterium]
MAKNYRRSFLAAFNGIGLFFQKEFNAKFHLFASILVIVLGFYYNLDSTQWLFLCVAISGVFVSEIFNTAIEQLCNRLTKEEDSMIKIVKDLSAGAVLVSVIFAVVAALIIFIPKIEL